MTKENNILLSEKRLSELGEQLNDIIHEIEMQNHVINFIPDVNSVKESPLVHYDFVYNALDTFFDTNQKTMKVLDKISFILQCLDDEKELKALGEKIEVAE